MIVSTNKADTMLKKSMGKNEVAIIAIDKMLDQLKLDPTSMNPVRHAYIVTDDDIKAMRIKQKFEQSVSQKHPATKVVFITKGSKPVYPNGLVGVDVFLTKPKPEEIQRKISEIVSGDISDVMHNSNMGGHEIPAYTPEAPVEQVEQQEQVVPEFVQQPQEEYIPVPEYVEETPVQTVQEDTSGRSDIIERIKATNTVKQISQLTREIDASNLIKELIDNNTTYAAVEEKLKTLTDAIYAIMSDVSIPTLDEKLSKVRALTHDKAFFATKGDTIFEQRLEEVIDAICSQTSALLNSRLSEIDTAIRRISTQKEMDMGNARLAGLGEEKVNIILELRTLESEILSTYKATDSFIVSSVAEMANRTDDISGSPLFNSHIRARGDMIVSDVTFNAIRAALEVSATKVTSEFKEMQLKIVQMIKLLDKLFDLDNEIIAAYKETVNFLRARNIEDTVVAQSLLKKSLRVFVGFEGTGRTIIPYLLSSYKSRTNANVLMVDLTGTGKYDHYSLTAIDLESYLVNLNQTEFCLVSGKAENTVVAAQRIMMALIKSADYYRVINVIIDPEQRELLETISQDVLCVNYLVDCIPAHIDGMAKIIRDTKYKNVGRRVILNKCDIMVRPIVTRLGLDDQLDFQLCTIPTVPALSDADLNGYNPYGVGAVTLAMKEVTKHA